MVLSSLYGLLVLDDGWCPWGSPPTFGPGHHWAPGRSQVQPVRRTETYVPVVFCSIYVRRAWGGGQAVISVPCMSWFQTVITCGRPLSSTRRCPGTLQQGLTGSRISSQFGSQVAAASPVEVCSPLDGCVVPRTYLCNLCRVQIFLYIGSKSQKFNWLDAILRFKSVIFIFFE